MEIHSQKTILTVLMRENLYQRVLWFDIQLYFNFLTEKLYNALLAYLFLQKFKIICTKGGVFLSIRLYL